MDPQRQRFRLGLFVVGTILLLGAMILIFGGAPRRFFTSRDTYYIVFTDAPGVGPGTPVRKSGIRIGEVASVELNDATGEVKVEIRIDKRYTIRKNEEAIISQDLLSRDTTIDFVPVTPVPAPKPIEPLIPPEPKLKPPEPIQPTSHFEPADDPQQPPANPLGDAIPPGSVIRGRAPTDTRAFLMQATEIIPTVQQSLAAIKRSVERFELMIPQIEVAVREFAGLGRAVREAVPEIRRTNDEIRSLVQN